MDNQNIDIINNHILDLQNNNLFIVNSRGKTKYVRFKKDNSTMFIALKSKTIQLYKDKELEFSIDLDSLDNNQVENLNTLFNPIKNEILKSPKEVLSSVYGYDEFRDSQEEIINSILNKEDTLVLMPTGGGKSLCFQVPALCSYGTAIVISPLISLMTDQVLTLKEMGVEAEFINSSLKQEDVFRIKNNISNIKLLYISPERFKLQSFQEWLQTIDISFFAIDESHCVSKWGHDFRPDYMLLNQIKPKFNKPIIALTATADLNTRKDIVEQLQMKNENTFISSFDRPNIKILTKEKNTANKQLLEFLNDFKNKNGVIYCLSRKKVEKTAKFLKEKGLNAIAYHAGLPLKERERNQKRFLAEDNIIAVATIAFGMGINKIDVRFVVHLDMPQNIESYYQEIGRAGRDGMDSTALLLYGMQDFILRGNMIFNGDSTRKMNDYAKLNEMLALAETVSCKRNYLMSYFGNHDVKCNNCSSCLNTEDLLNVTDIAKKVIETINLTGSFFGMNYIILLLKGSNAKNIKENHKSLTTYNSVQESDTLIKKVIRQLFVHKILEINLETGYNNLVIKKDLDADVFIKKEEKVKKQITLDNFSYSKSDIKSDLFDSLKSLRLELAQEKGIPPYLIIHDKSLMDMIKKKPKNLKELLHVHGWGETKANRYGQLFLDILNK